MLPLDDENPTLRVPFVTWILIAANILAFFWQNHVGLDRSINAYGFVPALVGKDATGEFSHAFTSMFLHGGWLHLLGNMWFLRIFGDNIEDELGHFKFLLFYLLSGFAGDAAHYFSDPASEIPSVGASGAISGVLGAYMMRHPMARVRMWTGFLLMPITEMPAIVFLFIWAAFQFLSAMAQMGMGRAGGVAYWAHLGGFAAGIVLVLILIPAERRSSSSGSW